MNFDLSGKRAVISGSTAGIGYAIAVGLVGAGAHVILNGRTTGRVDEAVRRLRAAVPNASVEGIAADLGTAEGAEAFMAKAPAADILINNLGIFEPKPFLDVPDEDWERFFRINVLSGVRLSRHYLPSMMVRGWGRIVFLSSESGVQIPVEMIHYGMTKTAQLAISRGLAEMAAGPPGVTVNAVLPGPTRSEGVGQFVADLARTQGKSEAEVEAEFFATVRPSSLIKRFAKAEEVANLVVYVCSPQASATTGAALRVDGGVIRAIVWGGGTASRTSMTGKRLLIVAHTPSPNTERLREAVVAGARSPEIEGVEVAALNPFATTADDVLAAQAIILGTTENLGYMSGALKDFFDRCYYPCLERTEGLPYALYIRAGHDGTGTRRGVETIVSGLRWRKIAEPLICRGAWREDFVAECRELGTLVAAGLEAGVF